MKMMNNFRISPQLIQAMKGVNPQQFAMNLLEKNAQGNPMLENILQLANNGDQAAVEQICKNAIRAKGYDPDELMTQFQNQIG